MHRKGRRILITLISAPLAFLFVVMPILSAAIYEAIFGARYTTAAWMSHSVEEFPNLCVEQESFLSGDTTLCGYHYFEQDQEARGVVVLAHGLGGGGHNGYMPLIAAFVAGGYAVFTYDAHGNDQSGGDIEGLPQGVADLDHALRYVKAHARYAELPLFLFGHSFGGYSAGAVLSLHPDVRAAALVAAFNESEDMLALRGEQYGGPTAPLALVYLDAYERLKFGREYADLSVLSGVGASDTAVLVVHGGQDYTVPTFCGYDKLYAAYADSARVDFLFCEDRGHEDILYSPAALAYRAELAAAYTRYLETEGKRDSAEEKALFMQEHLDKKQYGEPDSALMARILLTFEKAMAEA